MKGFSAVSRAATYASGVILESCSPESVVAKRRDSVQKPYGMTSVWGGRTVNTSILSFPSVVVGNLSLFKKENDNNGSPTKFLGDDGNDICMGGRTARAFVKRLVVLFLITLFAAVNAPAEIISAVSYNPSRMGDYVYLKVADKANLKGGIEANTMTVRSGGTVSASSPNLNYNVPAVVGESGSALDMPNTAIHGAAANTYDNYQAVNTGTPTALLNNVYVNGGTTTVKSDSYISTLDAVNRLKQKAATLRANKLSVSGSEDASLYDDATTDGFTLSGNDIPQPTSSHVNTGTALSKCTLKWEERVTSNNQKVKLLALANCNGSSDGDLSGSEKCTWGSKGNLMSCQIKESTYCQLLDNGLSQVEIMVSSTCGADRYVANSLSECPTATRGATCVVREQHSNRIACRYGQISSSKTVTMCQGRIYTATCKPAKL